VEDVNGHRGVERGVAVGKPGRVGAHRANAFAASLAFEPGEHRPREIDAEDGPDAPRERERDSAGADPDLEHTGIGPEAAGASEEVGHLRVDARRKAAGLVVLARDPVEGERSERLVGERSRLRLRHWLEDRRCRARRPAPVGAALGLEVAEHRAQAPGLFTGGTDARYYAKLTPNVFRFTPVRGTLEDLSGIHGANERIAIRVYASAVRFYVRLVENAAGQAERVAATLAR
jgi:acetylornithine deacetylase/succinyl-diaminopimelate desuccinylase-like protein